MNTTNPISAYKMADVAYVNAKGVEVLWFYRSAKRVKGKFVAVAKTHNADAALAFAHNNGLKVRKSQSKHRKVYTVED